GRGFGAVQGRRRGALEHLDALDRLGVDVVEARGAAPAAGANVIAEPARAVHAYAVHVHDRLVRLRQARSAADPDPGALTGHRARGEHGYAGLAGGELLREVGHRRVAQPAHVARRDRVAQLALLGFGAGAGADDHVEADCRLADREVRL